MRVLSIVHEPTLDGRRRAVRGSRRAARRPARTLSHRHDALGAGCSGRYDAIMVFGGAMHPDQDAEHPWLADEATFIREALDARGAAPRRLPRRAADRTRRRGARRPRRRARRSAGTTSTSTRPAAKIPCSACCRQRIDAFQWHYYGFELPAGAELLADERGRAPGLPARRAHLGRPVPPRGDAAHARPLVRRGSGRAAGSGRRSGPRRTRSSATWNEHGRRLVRRVPGLRRALSGDGYSTGSSGARAPTRAMSRDSCARRSRRAEAAATAMAERPPEWQ